MDIRSSEQITYKFAIRYSLFAIFSAVPSQWLCLHAIGFFMTYDCNVALPLIWTAPSSLLREQLGGPRCLKEVVERVNRVALGAVSQGLWTRDEPLVTVWTYNSK